MGKSKGVSGSSAHRRGSLMTALSRRFSVRATFYLSVLSAAIFVVALMIWQGVTAHGTPDPMQPDTSSAVATMDIGILVFREGLECILVLAAITASMTGSDQVHRRPVAIGAGMAFLATLVTWFIAIKIVGQLTESIPALDLQATTGLVAVIVLLVIMNWFFHKTYWGGWIRAHNRRRKALFASANGESSQQPLFWGLILLGFTSLYREGFEVVLFLQSYNLRLGGSVVLKGALLGLLLSGMVARAKRRVARPSPLGDGRCTYVRSAAASPISKDADYHRHSAGSRLGGNGG